MTRHRRLVTTERSRRSFLAAGILTMGGTLVSGCVTDSPNSDTDGPHSNADDEIDPALRINGKALHSAFPLEVFDPDSGERLVNVHWHGEFSHWHFGPLEIRYGKRRSVRVRFNDRDRNAVSLEADPYRLSVLRAANTPEELVEIAIDGAIVDIRGTENGEGELVFRLERDDEGVWTSPPLPVVVA